MLQRMSELGFITSEQLREALETEVQFSELKDINQTVAPHFVEFVRRELEKTYGADTLYRDGLRIETTLNLEKQRAADAAVALGIENFETRAGRTAAEKRVQSALLCIDPYTGHIHAMVGGRDYNREPV